MREAAKDAYLEASRLYRAAIHKAIEALNGGQPDAAIDALLQMLTHADESIAQLAVLDRYIDTSEERRWWAESIDHILGQAHALHASRYHPRTAEFCDQALALRLRAIASTARH